MNAEVSMVNGPKSKSAAMFKRASDVIPGGVSANIKYYEPYPIVMKHANGSKITDVDGNDYIDYLLCYGALITGHGHESVMQAANKHLQQIGTAVFGAPHELEITLAEKLVNLYSGIDMIRYTNSGLEATLLAIRMASAYTGKEKIGKFEGHYHGGYNQVLVSINPDLEEAGEEQAPNTVPESKGIMKKELEQTVVLPFNDLEGSKALLRKHAHELAAIIIEPVQSGFIPAEFEFIKGLREITKELGILLIFDEVKTGFRTSLGGAQQIYHVCPDLTALGKVLGGGYPVGAVGGRKEIMMTSAPNGSSDIFSAGEQGDRTDVLFHSGTYNGHPVVLAAGLATIELLEGKGVMESLINHTNLLRTRLEKLYASYQIPMQTIGMGSIFNIVLTDQPIRNYRDMLLADAPLRKAIDLELLDLGIYCKPGNRYSMSTVHRGIDIDFTIKAHEEAIRRVLH
ncbi:aspartate aminotransferase family protein [Virgibacillus kimchii]